jgi:putative endonuclease
MYHTYILYSEKIRKYYVGSTQDIETRLCQHNGGHTKSTKGKGPWKMVLSFLFETRSEAMQLERRIKKRGAERFLMEKGHLE